MSGGCPEVSGKCLEGVEKVSERCLEGVSNFLDQNFFLTHANLELNILRDHICQAPLRTCRLNSTSVGQGRS